jgi:hypothetical protein
VRDLEALVLHLVAAHEQLQAVALQECPSNIRPEAHAHAALGAGPAHARVRVAPQHLAHEALVRRLSEAVDCAQLIQRHVVAREEAAVDDEHLFAQNRAERQAAEELLEELHHRLVEFGANLACEPGQRSWCQRHAEGSVA